MSTPQERIQADVVAAMKSGDKELLATLRMLLADIKNERIKIGAEVDEERFIALVRRGIKQRHDAAEGFTKGGRAESAAKEEREAMQLEAYLPRQVDADEVRAEVERYVAAEGLSGMAAMGQTIKATLAHFGTRTDGATVSRIVREVLSS